MKFNQWTLGLAALGVVSLASAAKAEEKMSAVQSALSSTTISGYVDTSAQWNPGTGTGNNYYRFSEGKSDGFNLNVVQLTIAKPLDEAEWAAGYRADLWFGPDANSLNTTSWGGVDSSDLAIRQAYVALRTPVGNGLDWKMGVFDSPLGYESLESGNNPNFTRSYGSSLEPTTLTGLQLSYRFSDAISISGGIANTVGATINDRSNPPMAESYKTYFGTVALTAPDSWGFLKGSSLYFGVLNGYASGNGLPGEQLNGGNAQTSWYVGSTIATPIEGLKFGLAWDVLNSYDGSAGNKAGQTPGAGAWGNGNDAWAASAYLSYQATEKLSFHGRAELVSYNNGFADYATGAENAQIWSLTGTVQYDLWKNVISRLEVRWDFGDEGQYFWADSQNGNGNGAETTAQGMDDRRNSVMLALNVIYKF